MMLECVIIVVSLVIITARPSALNTCEFWHDVKEIESQRRKPIKRKTDTEKNNSRKNFFGDS